MLSYQHAYHAGNRADIHKHNLLAKALEALTRKDRALAYMETHAGRGVYDLTSAEAEKTGEAAQGWLELSKNAEALPKMCKGYIEAVRKLNSGGLAPRYPGSPYIAAQILRPHDQLHLMEMHPQEHEALEKVFRNDGRVRIHKRDGMEGVLAVSPPSARRGLVLIDPSYELKEEYETIPDFAAKLLRKWPEAAILIWVPMLPAGRHEIMVKKLRGLFLSVKIDSAQWPKKGAGIYGSIMAGINLPHGV